jgi:hypothetical protein
MAYLETDPAVRRDTGTTGWEALMANLDLSRIEIRRRPALQEELDRRVRHIQQMLLAGAMASGAIIAVAAVMLLRLL